jgi:hypothetical protein
MVGHSEGAQQTTIKNDKSARLNGKCSRRGWLQADFVVDRISEPLLAA